MLRGYIETRLRLSNSNSFFIIFSSQSDTSPVVFTTRVSSIESIVVSTIVKEAPKDVVEETIKSGSMTTVAPTPFDNIIVAYK